MLPRKNMNIVGSGVFWPLARRPALPARRRLPVPDLDHRLVWVDVQVPGGHDDHDDDDDDEEDDD